MAPTIARLVPERYQSETLILVVPQRVPDSYVKSTITQTVEDRLPSISDQILSRSRLEKIIADLNLYIEERKRQVMEDVVQRMRGDITVSLDAPSLNSFRVTFVSDDPETARKVTERLASLYIEQNLRDRESQADNTNQFLETQLQDAKQRLVEHEKKLEEYRRRFAGQLPSQLPGNLQAIQNAQVQLQSINESMNRAHERRLLIERQIADAQAPSAVLTPAVSLDSPPANGSQLISTAQQLEIARARLELAKLRFTPDHPEVLSLQRTVADLQTRLGLEAPVSDAAAIVEPTISPQEQAQKKRLGDLQAELDVIDHQLTANDAEAARLKQTIASYQAKIDVVPTRESELVELTRDYSTLQTGYTNLLTKREDSQISANLERRQIGEQFQVLDPASLPQRPYNERQRLLTMSVGVVGGLVFGLLVIGFLEYRDTSFRREEDVVRVLTVPVLALIPVMASDRERQAQRRRAWVVDFAGIAVLAGSAAVLAFWRMQW
jgi:polysaccharide chain length determinant protein (PEP-CTERM system associated)